MSDGCIRAETSMEALAGLKPAFDEKGSVTAGTSSPLTDGASACLVTSEDYAKAQRAQDPGAHQVERRGPAARRRSWASARSPRPSEALKRAGLTIKDIDIIELNEAFASQAIACMRELKIDLDKTNLDGGAIALGHPLGATGARITGKAAALLKREGKQFALATQCIGGGQGIATILEAGMTIAESLRDRRRRDGQRHRRADRQCRRARPAARHRAAKMRRDRSAIAKGAIDKLLKADPAPFMSKAAARLITPGNIEDDLGQLADVDWIVEAVIERARHQAGRSIASSRPSGRRARSSRPTPRPSRWRS